MVRRIAVPRVDPRVVIGLALVGASVAGVVAVTGVLETGVLVYAAHRPLGVGERIDAGDLVLAEVRLGESEPAYLRAEQLPLDAVLVRPVGAGELLPAASVGSVGAADLSPVVLPVTAGLPRAADSGSMVDVWSAPSEELGGFGPPRVLVERATVVRVLEGDAFGTAEATSVEVLVPDDDVAAVLDAAANGAAISLVPSSVSSSERSR